MVIITNLIVGLQTLGVFSVFAVVLALGTATVLPQAALAKQEGHERTAKILVGAFYLSLYLAAIAVALGVVLFIATVFGAFWGGVAFWLALTAGGFVFAYYVGEWLGRTFAKRKLSR